MLGVTAANAARFIILLGTGVVAGLAVLVILSQALRIAHGRKGLLPWHVLTIAVSYLCFMAIAGSEVYERMRLTQDASWRIPVGLLGVATGIVALNFILSYMRRNGSGSDAT